MAERVSALRDAWLPGRFGDPDRVGVTIESVGALQLRQVAAWPDTAAEIGRRIADLLGAERAPGPGRAVGGAEFAALRVEPLKWWLVGVDPPALAAAEGATLDLSHARTRIRVGGDDAAEFLNRHLPLDLREAAFPADTVASSAIHHCGVTLWRSPLGYELFLPRSFAQSLWQILFESAEQFGLEVR